MSSLFTVNMDPTSYKTIATRRGFTYSYYFQSASSGRPTLLFIHGFPSSSLDWRYQVAYFEPKGYGVVVPDLFGYGGTSKPEDYVPYEMHGMVQDIIDILDAEKVDKVISVAHDWGSVLQSRLSDLHSGRFLAFAFLGGFWLPPWTAPFDVDAVMKRLKGIFGYEVYAYWHFMLRPDAAALAEKNIDSFLQLLYPKDAETWREYMGMLGKTDVWIETNMQTGPPAYVTAEEYARMRETFVANGLRGPLNWYVSCVKGNGSEQQRTITTEDCKIPQPVLYGYGARDYVNIGAISLPTVDKLRLEGTDVKVVEFDSGHWIMLEATSEFNKELESWIHNEHMKT